MTTTAGRPVLNDAQKQALALMDAGPLRVIAGPGTGKTTTVVATYLRLLEERGLKPSQVLLLTFASNAASGPRALEGMFARVASTAAADEELFTTGAGWTSPVTRVVLDRHA